MFSPVEHGLWARNRVFDPMEHPTPGPRAMCFVALHRMMVINGSDDDDDNDDDGNDDDDDDNEDGHDDDDSDNGHHDADDDDDDDDVVWGPSCTKQRRRHACARVLRHNRRSACALSTIAQGLHGHRRAARKTAAAQQTRERHGL